MNPLLLKKLKERLNGIVISSIILESGDVVIVKNGVRVSNIRLTTIFDKIKLVSATKSSSAARVDVGRWVNDDNLSMKDIPPVTVPDLSNFNGLTIINVGLYQTKSPVGLKTTVSLTAVPDPEQPSLKVATVAIGFVVPKR